MARLYKFKTHHTNGHQVNVVADRRSQAVSKIIKKLREKKYYTNEDYVNKYTKLAGN